MSTVRVNHAHQYLEAGTRLNENGNLLFVYKDQWGPNHILDSLLSEEPLPFYVAKGKPGPPPWAPCPPRNPHCVIEIPVDPPIYPPPTHDVNTPEPGTAFLLLFGLLCFAIGWRWNRA